MSTEVEKVEYILEGNSSSLSQAVDEALKSLDKYYKMVSKKSLPVDFSGDMASMSKLKNTLASTKQEVQKLQAALKGIGDIKLAAGTTEAQALSATIRSVTSQMEAFKKISELTGPAMNNFNAYAAYMRQALNSVIPSYDALIQKAMQAEAALAQGSEQLALPEASTAIVPVSQAMDPLLLKYQEIARYVDYINARNQAFSSYFASSFDIVASSAESCAAAFRRVAQAEEEAASSSDTIEAEFEDLGSEVIKVANKNEQLEDSHEEASSAAKKHGDASQQLSKVLSKVGNVVKKVSSVVMSFLGIDIGKVFGDSVNSAIDLVESQNMFAVAMGDSIDMGNRFVEQMQEVYGLDPNTIYKTAGNFYQLTDALGATEEASATMSLSLTKATNDLASLFNTDFNTVAQDLQSGMQGMTRAVRKYGMDIRSSTIQQTAYKYGLEESVQTMSESNRQALRYLTMMDQMRNATKQVGQDATGASVQMGDFARTIEQPANQLRIFKEQISQLGRAIGNFLVVPLAKVLPYINGFVMALRTAINYVSQLLGFMGMQAPKADTYDAVASSIKGVGDSASKAADQMKSMTAPFDELNVLSQDSGSGSGTGDSGMAEGGIDPALMKALQEQSLELENISMKANQVRDNILSFMGLEVDAGKIISFDPNIFKQNLQKAIPGWTKTIEALFNPQLFSGITSMGKGVLALIDDMNRKVLEFIGVFINDTSVSTFLNTMSTAFSNLGPLIDQNASSINDMVLYMGGLTGGFSDWASMLEFLKLVTSDLQSMWSTSFAPLVESLGGLLSGLFSTLQTLYREAIQPIQKSIDEGLTRLWSTVLKPVIEQLSIALSKVIKLITRIWNESLGPVITHIAKGVKELWINVLQPIIEKIVGIIGDVIRILLGLWNNVLYPIVDWIWDKLGPIITKVFKGIWDVIQKVVSNIGGAINGILGVFKGITSFLADIFTGQWKKALSGLLNILIRAANKIADVVESIINGVIGIVNNLWKLLYGAIAKVVNGIGDLIGGIAEALGFDINLSMSAEAPTIPKLSIATIPSVALARGGVVSGPTRALIGEGRYDEAVIPLDNSPQMKDLVQKIADAVDDKNGPQPGPTEVHVYIGGDEYDVYTYEAAQRGKALVGAEPIRKE